MKRDWGATFICFSVTWIAALASLGIFCIGFGLMVRGDWSCLLPFALLVPGIGATCAWVTELKKSWNGE